MIREIVKSMEEESNDIGEQITNKYFSDTKYGVLIVDDGEYVIEVVKIRVARHLQRLGIATKMINDLKEYSNKTGKPIVLDSIPDIFSGTMNQKTLNDFYEKNEFIKISSDLYPTTRKVVGQAYKYEPNQKRTH